MNLKGKKLLMMIAPEKFRDEEYEIPFALLSEQGAKITTASTKKGIAQGMFGKKATVDTTFDEINAKDFDAIIYVGGQGTPTVRSNAKAVELAQTFFAQKKVVAAICWAPTILAKAGILQNKKATVWLGDDDEYKKKTSQVLNDLGGQFVAQDVVVDGNIVTGNGPEAAKNFAQALIKVLPKY